MSTFVLDLNTIRRPVPANLLSITVNCRCYNNFQCQNCFTNGELTKEKAKENVKKRFYQENIVNLSLNAIFSKQRFPALCTRLRML